MQGDTAEILLARQGNGLRGGAGGNGGNGGNEKTRVETINRGLSNVSTGPSTDDEGPTLNGHNNYSRSTFHTALCRSAA